MRVILALGAIAVAVFAILCYEEPAAKRIPDSNWEGVFGLAAVPNVTVHDLASESEVVQLIRRAASEGKRVKVVGTGHSWADIAVPRAGSLLVSLRRMDKLVAVDSERSRITVQPGMQLREMADHMAEHGLALHNFPSVDEQTVAGAIATATHGLGISHQNLAAAVRRLRVVDASGQAVTATPAKNRDLFRAAAVSLGALGVVTEVTLQCVPLYRVRVHQLPVPDADIIRNWDAYMRSGEFVKFWWVPHTGYTVVFAANKTDVQEDAEPMPRPLAVALSRVVSAAQALSSLVPVLIKPFNVVLRTVGFREAVRVARWDKGLVIPFPVPPHAEIEYSVPSRRGVDFFLAIRALFARENVLINQIVEIRFVAGDDLWLSSNHGEDRCHITILLPKERGPAATRSIFAAVERVALGMGGRPHWAKTFYATPPTLARAFPRWNDWHRVRCEQDPRGMFANGYLDRTVGTARKSCALAAAERPPQ